MGGITTIIKLETSQTVDPSVRPSVVRTSTSSRTKKANNPDNQQENQQERNCKVLRTENPGSLCACAIGETKQPSLISSVFTKKYRVGSRIEINLFTDGLRKAVSMTPSMALLKDVVVHKATHVFFYAFGASHGG